MGNVTDLGFLGVDKPDDPDDLVIVTGFKATRYRKLTAGQKEANRALAAGRAPVEHGFAHLKNWRNLTKLRTDPARATALLRALLASRTSKSPASQMIYMLDTAPPPARAAPPTITPGPATSRNQDGGGSVTDSQITAEPFSAPPIAGRMSSGGLADHGAPHGQLSRLLAP